MLFKDGKIYLYSGQRNEFTKEGLLNYLSADNYIELSTVWNEDSEAFLQ